MTMTLRRIVAVGATALIALAGCASGGSSGSGGSGGSGDVTIGTTLSLTGPLGALGTLQQQGYQQAVDWANESGGLQVGGAKRRVDLVVLDNRSDPNLASQQARELVLKNQAAALLGPSTPPITIPVAQVAEAQKIPLLATITPVDAFAAGNPAGWKYSWDMFFSENNQAKSVSEALKAVPSNGKVALFTDTEPDGVVERDLYKQAMSAAGLTVVGDYTFPVGTTDFSSFLGDAKAKGAQLVAAQTIPPDGIALWKQMKALALQPVAAFSAKAAVSGAWWQALGPVAEGTLTEGFWSPALNNPDTDRIKSSLGAKIKTLPDLGVAVVALSTGQVLLDAISAAGSTDPNAINDAIGKTDKTYPVGPVKFSDKHTSVTPHLILQWHDGDAVQVIPKVTSDLQSPAAGLA